jgi:hypothetical protein
MKHVVRCILCLLANGFTTAPLFAAELRVTGFFDNVFPHWQQNISGQNGDNDATRNSDEAFWGRTRFRGFFNFIATDDLRGVFAIEIDQSYGAPAINPTGSGCVTGTGTYANEQCGFRNGIDNNAIEVKQLYVDFRIPQVPIGNRTQLGGLPFNLTPIHSGLLYTMDAGGGMTRLDFTDRTAALFYYVQLEEDVDRYPGSPKVGEDYLTGSTLMLKPLSGLDLHLLGVYFHGQAPFGPSLTGSGGPFDNVASDSLNVTTESRYYLGFDSRYRIGNTSIEPTFIYLLGTRNFNAPSAAVTGLRKTDYDAFQASIAVFHTLGPWLFGGKFGYSSGDDANDNLNNTRFGNRSDVNGFRTLGNDGSHYFGEWFEILGKSDIDGNSIQTFRRQGEVGKLDRFGWIMIGGKAEYQYTDNLTLEGAAGGFWTAEKTACPATFRANSLSGPCTANSPPLNSSGEPTLNFTGNSSFVGWEVDAGVRYQIMPGLTWTPRMGYAGYGSALAANNRNQQGAWTLSNRLIYIF